MRLRGDNRDRARYLLWPIRLGWKDEKHLAIAMALPWRWIDWHGWQVGYERVPVAKTSFGCVPGVRAVFGQTLHIGRRLMILFGEVNDERRRKTFAEPPRESKGMVER